MLPNNNNPISLKMYIDYYRTHHNHPPIFETIDDNTLKKQEYNQGIYKDLSGFQIETLDKMIKYYKNNDKGYLNICCRMGKTRLSLCFIRYMKFNNVIVFVPAKVLLDQWENAIKQILPSYKVIKFDPSNKKINKQQDNTIYISHYINSDQFMNNNYDFKIFDELHHLTCIDLDKQEEKFRKQYINCLKVKSKYQLGLTATLKIINNQSEKKRVISNDDKKYFGELIDKRTFNEGVKYKRLCPLFVHLTEHRTDYNKLDVKQRKEINIKKGIKSILKLMFEDKVITKNIFFVNSIKSIINVCIPYIEKQIQKHNYNLNVFKYHTSLRIKKDNKTVLIKASTDKQILTNFETCKNGILFAVYGLSEGFDMPYLDSVCIGEKMTTNIRIAQSILRPTTYDVNNPNKISHIILPCTFDKKDNIDTIKNIEKNKNIKKNKDDFRKVMNVLYQLQELKINVYQLIIVKDNTKMSRKDTIKSDTLPDNVIFSSKFLESALFQTIQHKMYTYEKAIEKIKKYKQENNITINSINQYNKIYMNISKKLPKEPEKYYEKDNFKWANYFGLKYPKPEDMKNIIIEFNNNSIKKINKFNVIKMYENFMNYLKNKNIVIFDDKKLFLDLYKNIIP